MAQVHRLYEYDYETGRIRLKGRKCPKCGSIMAYHRVSVERHSCGRCGFTEYVRRGI